MFSSTIFFNIENLLLVRKERMEILLNLPHSLSENYDAALSSFVSLLFAAFGYKRMLGECIISLR